MVQTKQNNPQTCLISCHQELILGVTDTLSGPMKCVISPASILDFVLVGQDFRTSKGQHAGGILLRYPDHISPLISTPSKSGKLCNEGLITRQVASHLTNAGL